MPPAGTSLSERRVARAGRRIEACACTAASRRACVSSPRPVSLNWVRVCVCGDTFATCQQREYSRFTISFEETCTPGNTCAAPSATISPCAASATCNIPAQASPHPCNAPKCAATWSLHSWSLAQGRPDSWSLAQGSQRDPCSAHKLISLRPHAQGVLPQGCSRTRALKSCLLRSPRPS